MSKEYRMLLLTGDLTIRSATQTKQLVDEALAEAAVGKTELVVDIAAEHAADLTLPQILLSAKRTADRAQMSFRLKHAAIGSLLTVLERGGLVGAEGADNDFWLHEGVTQ